MAYFDYAATTPVSENVQATMAKSWAEDFGNPSATYALGRAANQEIDQVRRQIASSLNASPQDIIFVSSGTEANNSALIQTAYRLADQGKHIISTAAEHPSVAKSLAYLADQGFEVTYLDLDSSGHISLAELEAAIRPDTIMVSIIAGQNEVGSVQDLKAIGDFCQTYDLFFHTDTVQAYMNIEIDVGAMHIDALSMSAHKIYGPKGIGFMYYRQAKQNFKPYLHGGNQEMGLRAGTESLPLIKGLGQAIGDMQADSQGIYQATADRRQYFIDQAKAAGLEFEINGPDQVELPHVLNIYWPGHKSEIALIKFDLAEFYLSAGSACSAGSLQPSPTLVSMFGQESDRITESLRISFSHMTSYQEIDQLINKMLEM
ncbi:cysteine desulfurase [Aerococcus urinaehominis]|uniref:cysteine desulfurase n=1 Tax=Aerococcus urinaehominis TaxID=128944 RepID=A0A109RH46_9LACT|nr:cysteine desulfurase family protein [Aerococcus urinaehominis]AMB99756.1 cysteine desulfurase [Aerococcus urinaehominis]SDM10155.1 cysteine desulfurase [Aerococcus urinaehominis]